MWDLLDNILAAHLDKILALLTPPLFGIVLECRHVHVGLKWTVEFRAWKECAVLFWVSGKVHRCLEWVF